MQRGSAEGVSSTSLLANDQGKPKIIFALYPEENQLRRVAKVKATDATVRAAVLAYFVSDDVARALKTPRQNQKRPVDRENLNPLLELDNIKRSISELHVGHLSLQGQLHVSIQCSLQCR